MECRWPDRSRAAKEMPQEKVAELAGIFRVLADPSRLRILDLLLRDGERPVSDLAGELGMNVAAVSGQLRKMADLGFLGRSVRGNHVFYRVIDPCLPEILHRAHCLAEDGKMRGRRSA